MPASAEGLVLIHRLEPDISKYPRNGKYSFMLCLVASKPGKNKQTKKKPGQDYFLTFQNNFNMCALTIFPKFKGTVN